MSAPSSAPEAQQVWYIQAAERIWGPYRQARLAGFVVERRLTADTLVATHSGGPFGPAGRRADLQRLFEPFTAPVEASPPPPPTAKPSPIRKDPKTAASTKPEPQPKPRPEPQPRPEPIPAAVTPDAPRASGFSRKACRKETAADAPRHALLVWVDLTSLTAQAFEAALAKHGAFAGVRPGVWLVRAETQAAALRNALSRELTGEDALLVVEAPLEHAAWFNLDLEAESNLRRLWGGAEG